MPRPSTPAPRPTWSPPGPSRRGGPPRRRPRRGGTPGHRSPHLPAADVALVRAQVFRAEGRLGEALADLTAADGPDGHLSVRFFRALLLAQTGRLDEAAAVLGRRRGTWREEGLRALILLEQG